MSGLGSLLPFVLIAVIFWFLLIRPQRRRSQELATTQRSLDVGDEVMLGAGIFGTVVEVGDDALQIETAPGTRMKVSRQAVVRVIPPEEPEPPAASDEPEQLRELPTDAEPGVPPEPHGDPTDPERD